MTTFLSAAHWEAGWIFWAFKCWSFRAQKSWGPLYHFPTDNACLLLDVYMPEISGIELYRNLVTSGQRLPTVLMSGRDDQEIRQIMHEAKAVACLLKPFNEELLMGAMHRIAQRAELATLSVSPD